MRQSWNKEYCAPPPNTQAQGPDSQAPQGLVAAVAMETGPSGSYSFGLVGPEFGANITGLDLPCNPQTGQKDGLADTRPQQHLGS